MNNKKVIPIIGIIISIVFLGLGIFTQVPSREIETYGVDSYKEYVGGDAYNIQIEASLRGGEIAGAKIQKAIYFSTAGIIFVVSLFCFSKITNRKDSGLENAESVNKSIPQNTFAEFVSYVRDTEHSQKTDEDELVKEHDHTL